VGSKPSQPNTESSCFVFPLSNTCVFWLVKNSYKKAGRDALWFEGNKKIDIYSRDLE